jgi:RNA polymerase sigma-70 factor (ECF subfamily)
MRINHKEAASPYLKGVISVGALTMRTSQPTRRKSGQTRQTPVSKEAFEAELVRLIPEVNRFARSLCRGSTACQDLAQETLVKALQARRSFIAGTSMMAWLVTIIKNVHVSLWRRARWTTPLEPIHLNGLVDDRRAQESWMEFQGVNAAFMRLPLVQREAVAKIAIGGASYREASRAARCPMGTIKSRLHRARDALAAAVSREGRSPPIAAVGERLSCSIS